MKLRILDLCSGLGGASEAFIQGGHVVFRIENNPLLAYLPHTHTLDVLEWMDWLPEMGHFDIVIAAPPCTGFSDGYHSPKSQAARAGQLAEYEPDMAIVEACLAIFRYLNPTWRILENVRGAGPYFRPLIGRPRQQIGPFFLWGDFPHIEIDEFVHSKTQLNTPADRAKWPFELSFALLKACREQFTLARWS